MSHESLDYLLERSAPRIDASPETDLAATTLARAALTESRRRSRTSHVIAAIAAAVGAISLTAGAAVAISLLTDWRQWEPKNDIFAEAGPFPYDGYEVVCTASVSAIVRPETADAGTLQRLQAARSYLEGVQLDDFEAETEARLASGDFLASPMGEEFDKLMALFGTVGDAAREAGLEGGGVEIASVGGCEPYGD